MKNLKKFNEENWYINESNDLDPFDEENWNEKLTLSQEEFEQEKNIIINNINDLINSYDELTKHVSPKYWRSISYHFSNLKELRNDVRHYTLMTKKERDAIDRMGI